MSGLEFRKKAHKIPACIFVSSHPELAAGVFEMNTLDFITKPLTSERFHYSMQKLFTFLK
jgi:two-component SAPR family response regulator